VNLNGEESNFFKQGKGSRQEDPISSLLLNLAGDVLTKMLMKGAGKGLIKGVAKKIREGGIISLPYADDAILFSGLEDEYTRNLKGILMWLKSCLG